MRYFITQPVDEKFPVWIIELRDGKRRKWKEEIIRYILYYVNLIREQWKIVIKKIIFCVPTHCNNFFANKATNVRSYVNYYDGAIELLVVRDFLWLRHFFTGRGKIAEDCNYVTWYITFLEHPALCESGCVNEMYFFEFPVLKSIRW